ncbi:uncharacterized protein LOC120651566 [Panicum virgatum]|uniref:Late embryogenesis abundant protein LEA-2 subgroup domain-containing protein n=1 Tax=Panicum virgatum TaxID=38727 RepID=A0A8T0XK69_PANVG|nr:uncharacterized protein LOC120651566 [Panicum virgatum]KAG2657633.1 hypothetical protein PVAP13_1KG183000 [Panicum virgatum]
MIRCTGAMGGSGAVVKPPSPRLLCTLISCGIASTLVAAALLAVTLAVYRVREPVMTMNSISLKDPGAAAAYSSSPSSSTPPPLPSLTVVADVSVRNPNAASLRYGATETSVYYRARQVGEATGPPGTAPARRTVRMNVTVDVAVGALLGDPAFLGDVAAGAVAVATATRVRGRVAVLGGLVRRRVVLEMNCTATIAVADMSISDQSCEQRVRLR